MIKYKHAFAYSMNELSGGYTGEAGPAFIQTLNPGKAAYAKPRMLSPLHRGIVDKKCRELLEAGLIEPAPFSRHASRLTVAAKKDVNGEWVDQRMCGDYRAQNLLNATQQTRSANAEELFREIGDSKYFSKLDLRSGFLQIPMHPDCMDMTAFWWDGNLYRYKYLPFGMRQSPQIFQRVMDVTLRHLPKCTKIFLDDILVHSSTFEQHLIDLEAVMQALDAVHLRVHAEKTILCTRDIDFLGFDVGPFGITPQEAKVAALKNLAPKRKIELARLR